MNLKYWEEYAQQDLSTFTHVGVNDNIKPITNIEEQVAEFQRIYGKACEIRVYRDSE